MSKYWYYCIILFKDLFQIIQVYNNMIAIWTNLQENTRETQMESEKYTKAPLGKQHKQTHTKKQNKTKI